MSNRSTRLRLACAAGALSIAGLATACGSGTTTPQATSPAASPTPAPTATPAPTPTPRPPLPDAHQLTFQASDIPPGFAPHATSIMTLDTRTAVSEQLVTDGSVLTANGLLSGAEYGWESTSTKTLAMQNAVFVLRDVAGATAVFSALDATAVSHTPHVAPPSPVGDSTVAFVSGHLAIVMWRHGRIATAVEVTDSSLPHAMQLAQQLDARFATYAP